MLQITTKAKIYLTNYCRDVDSNGITLEVRAGGCAGYRYKWEESKPIDKSISYIIIPLLHDFNLYIDSISAELLMDSTIDIIKNVAGTSVTVINNQAKSKCGCGESFSI